MSCYIEVKNSNLIIKRENFKNIVKACQELGNINENLKKFKDIKSIKEVLDFIGIPYFYDEENDYYKIEEYGGEFYEILDFELVLKTIAENLQENEHYEMVIGCYEYQENTLYVFENKKLKIYYEEKVWKEKESTENNKLEKEKNTDLTEYEKAKGYVD